MRSRRRLRRRLRCKPEGGLAGILPFSALSSGPLCVGAFRVSMDATILISGNFEKKNFVEVVTADTLHCILAWLAGFLTEF